LWQFETSAALKASPMTYEFDGQQFIAVAAGQSILSFGLNQ
jgi:alcohol dehydrogenase (cytochrome c)